jgi:CRISPR-associated exonuclease Cas4
LTGAVTTDVGDEERTLVPISAIEHWSYCPRQCGLIHLERTFDENLYTIRGRLAHERVDEAESDRSDDLSILRSLPLWSDRLGIVGRADIVEMRKAEPYPIEYKVGPPTGRHAALQLCAQALCLEEMTGIKIPRGATFHVATRRRVEVLFDASLRAEAEAIVVSIRAMLDAEALPAPVADSRCRHCSLADSCQPTAMMAVAARESLDAWLFELPTADTCP